ncbi:glutaredoxin domain-containing protein [Nanoarchaeota archaeon]
MKAKIYTKVGCPYCTRAKQMLADKDVEFEEIVLSDAAEFEKLKQETNHMTVPQVFIDGEFIGGSDDLEDWFNKKEKD